MSSPEAEPCELGTLLRQWRSVRGTSQLDLASVAGTTPRYVSFVETGRARPSRKMVLRLARALDVPLRERNELLLAAGFAPLYAVEPISSPSMAVVERAFAAMLSVHEPFPAVLMDRRWDVQRANDGAVRLFTRLLAPEPMPSAPNVLRLVLEPGPVRNRLCNWHNVAPALLERVRREAVGGVLDSVTRELVASLQSQPELQRLLDAADDRAPSAPVIDLHFELDGNQLNFFSIVTTVGSPSDVTAQELRLEAFVPSNDATRDHWLALSTKIDAS